MRVSFPASLFLFAAVFVGVADAQTPPADSDPVLQESATYTMPQLAIDAEITGTVTVALRVDETGKPTNAVLISGPMWPCGTTPIKALEELASTLSDTMMKLRFSPGVKNGKPVAANIGFKLNLKNSKLVAKPPEIDAATGKPKPTPVSGGVLNRKAKYLPKPSYPIEARANRDSGAVTVQVLVDEEGKVIRAGGVSGAPTLQLASRESACGAKFPVMMLSGNPVKVSGVSPTTSCPNRSGTIAKPAPSFNVLKMGHIPAKDLISCA